MSLPVDRKKKSNESGHLLIVGSVLLLFVILPVIGLAVDAGVAYLVKARLQTAVDGAAIAAARSLSRGKSLGEQQTSATSMAGNFFRANSSHEWLRNAVLNVTFPAPPDPATNVVQVRGTVRTPTYFLQVMGINGIDVAAMGEATRRMVNVMMVLDRSGSLQNVGACDDLRDAAAKFVTAFQDGQDKVGMITFGTSYKEDFAIADDFQSRSTNLLTMIPQIRCIGGTNAAAAMSEAWQKLQSLNDRGALNAIVFFTDGKPNTLHLNQLEVKANCDDTTTPREGVIAAVGTPPSGQQGLYKSTPMGFPIPSSSNDVEVVTNKSTGCNYRDDGVSHVAEDFKGLARSSAAVDAWNNGLRTGYKPVTLVTNNNINYLRISGQDVENAGINALDSAARRARQEAVNANMEFVIYSVALGGPGAPEHDLLRRVSNVPEAGAAYDSTKPAGMYMFAENASQLEHAFATLASDILRVSK